MFCNTSQYNFFFIMESKHYRTSNKKLIIAEEQKHSKTENHATSEKIQIKNLKQLNISDSRFEA